MALTIITWLWGTKYNDGYVDKLERGLARNLLQPYRFMVVEPDPNDPLLGRGCFVRLKMFDPQWQAAHNLTGRIVCIDLDVVITGELDPLFNRRENFLIWKGANAINPCPYNGSLFMLRAGAHADVWQSFSLEQAYRLPFYSFPDDQTWLAHKLPGAAGWMCGSTSGIWSFRKRGWPHDDQLPPGARMVAFPGAADPKHIADLPWMRMHWK